MNRGEQIQILIADDETSFLRALATYLSRDDRVILQAHNGNEALRMLEETPSLDIVVTDLVMPGADGLAVLRKALALNPNKLVILMTGFGSMDTAALAIKEGAFDYRGKPFLLEEIGLSIQRAVAHIQLRRERDQLVQERKKLKNRIMKLQRKLDRIKDGTMTESEDTANSGTPRTS